MGLVVGLGDAGSKGVLALLLLQSLVLSRPLLRIPLKSRSMESQVQVTCSVKSRFALLLQGYGVEEILRKSLRRHVRKGQRIHIFACRGLFGLNLLKPVLLLWVAYVPTVDFEDAGFLIGPRRLGRGEEVVPFD